MFRSKKDVDRHVQDIFRKLKNENEKNLRCYNIAKLYYQVGEFESARRYVSSYLEVRESSAGAHKLLGQALEALGYKELALAQYKISLELEGRQDSLVLKVCELLADMDVAMDVNRVRYWVERADKQFPHHPIVFQLKEKMLTVERPNDNSEDLEALIASELSARPTDVHLRVKLINHYITRHKLDDAYKHAADVESTHGHRNCIVWYQCLTELLTKCKENKHSDFPFWILYISTLERYTALSLKEQGNDLKKTIPEATQAVFNFDQSLTEFHSKGFFDNPTFSEQMVMHMWGQLHFHLACLLLRKTKREQGSWSEAGRLCAPLLLGALHVAPIDPAASWATHLKEQFKSHVRLWYKEGSYRCSQAGHVLQDYARDDTKKLMDKIDKFCTGQWRERIYQRIFMSRIYQQVIGTSFFTNHTAANPPLRLCSHSELKQYDEVAEEVWPDSLHHQVWLGIKSKPHGKNPGPHPHMYSHVFPELQFSIYNLNQAAPDTLSRLDIDAFLNAAVLCSSVVLAEDQQLNDFLSPDRFPTLPADLTTSLCASAQEKWWSSAYKMYSKQETLEGDIGEIRQELQRGLEVVRCIGNHGLHPALLVHLARIFHHRAKVLKEKDKEHSDIPALEARCETYWSTAIPLLERLQNNQTIRISSFKLFNYQGKDMNNVELTNALEEGRLLLAQKFVRDKQYEEAIDALQVLRCPEASFQQGQIYKILADELVSSMPRESLTSEMRSQHIIMLSKARNCFYLTLDRLRSPGTNPKHPLNAELCTHISEIENELKRIDPDLWRGDLSRNGCDGMSEESYCSANSGDQPIANAPQLPNLSGMPASVNILNTPQRNTQRTPKQTSTPCRPQHQDVLDLSRNRTEARPSPERLDAQIRQMIHSRDNVMQTIIEQNKAVLDSHKTILEKIDDLCKEMAELRKETQKQRQTPAMNSNLEDDLYVLGDEDYGDLSYNANQSDPTAMASNMFTPSHRHPYSQLVYPSATAFQGYYQGGIPFNDPNAQAIPSLYPPNVYPMPVIYPNRQKLPENLMQQGLFTTRLPTQLTTAVDLMQPVANQAMQMQAMQKLDVTKPPEPSVAMPVIVQVSAQAPTQPPTQVPAQVPAPVPAPVAIIKDVPVNKAPPVNVVITTSDTLPTTVPPNRMSAQPTLSVTIPPQYRLGTTATISTTEQTNVPHSYQISMPLQATIPTTVNLPPLPATLITTPANMSTPVVQTDSNVSTRPSVSPNTSADLCEVEHDPIPDFLPVIPLPAEVKVTTGEENETTLYCARAKLFRFVDKEWKERGVGNVKLLQNAEGKVRLLMRRDQVLKICANHLLRPDMELTAMPNNDKAWIWVANDFADEEVKLERLCIKFKTADEAASFKEHFDKARTSLTDSPEKSFKTINKKVSSDDLSKHTTPDKSKTAAATNIVGGFSFSTKPIIQNVFATEATKTTKVEETKPSPFSEFSFSKSNKPPEISGYASTSMMTTTTTTTTTATSKKSGTPETAYFGSQSGGFSFVKTHAEGTPACVSSTADSTTATTGQSSNSVGEGAVSTSAVPKTLRRPHAPALSKTGAINETVRKSDTIEIQMEPDESIVFDQKAHLQCYNKDTKQWEDRGVGPMKIMLGSKSRKIRLFMHDERTSEVCYSQHVSADTKFAFKRGSSVAVAWTIGKVENKSESYALLFKLPDHALQFYNNVMSNQQKLSKDRTVADKKKQEPKKAEASNDAGVKQQPKLSELFKPAAGSWECNACYTRNGANDTKCLACQNPAPSSAASTGGSAPPVASTVTPVTSSNQVPLSQLYKPPPGSWRCETCYINNMADMNYCVACDTPKDPSMPPKPKSNPFNLGTSASEATPTFSFGIPQDTAKEASGRFTFRMPKADDKAAGDASKTSPASIFGGGIKVDDSATKFTFGATPRPSTPPNKDSPFTFGSPGKSFGFQFSTKSPVKSPGGGATSEDEVENDDIHFSPIIPMPAKIEVKTGEEDEETLYSHRAKLFRYDSSCKEWKERGLGDIKLLKHKESGKLRLIMRRDQILKLCLNHFVLPDIEFTPKDEKTWLWNAADYSEGEIEYMQFACRFKTADIAGEFKKAVEDAKKMSLMGNKEVGTKKALSKEVGKTSPSQDIQVLYERKVTDEEKAAALKLQLPENFYAYKQKEDCPGCLGCREPGITLFGDNKDAKKAPFANIAKPGTTIFGDKTPQKSPFSTKLIASEKTPSKATEGSTTSGATTPSQPEDSTSTVSATNATDTFSFSVPKTTTAPVKPNPRTPKYTFENFQPQQSAGFVFGADLCARTGDTPVSSNGSADQSKTQSNFENFTICSPTTETQTQETTLPAFNTSVGPVFGRTQPAFGDGAQTTSIFGSSTTSNNNIFGGNVAKTTSSSLIKPAHYGLTNPVTTAPSTTASNLVSQTKSSTPVFGGSSTTSPSFTSSITSPSVSLTFGGGNLTGGTVFGTPATLGFGNTMIGNSTTNVFGSGVSTTFGSAAATFDSAGTSDSAETKGSTPLFATDDEISFLPTDNVTFSTLAKKQTTPEGFKIDPNFSFVGAGSSVFGSSSSNKDQGSDKKKNQSLNKSATKDAGEDDNDNEENDGEHEHDPHFEPVIPLPDAVEVRTGEEDEEKVFSDRAKLYRHDGTTKEWKERGVGEMKILHHAEHGTYRLLLRREQVHKVVCNFLIQPDVEFRPLSCSDRAWVWAGMNHAESPAAVENLAIKFKNAKVAAEFKSIIDAVQQKMRDRLNAQGGKNEVTITEEDQGVEDEEKEEENDDEDDDDDDDDDDEDESEALIIFQKRATLFARPCKDAKWEQVALGNLSIYYYSAMSGAKIVMRADESDEIVSDTLISVDTVMEVDGKECVWTALDYALKTLSRRTLKAVFSSTQAAQQMFKNFQEFLDSAKQTVVTGNL